MAIHACPSAAVPTCLTWEKGYPFVRPRVALEVVVMVVMILGPRISTTDPEETCGQCEKYLF